MDFTPNTPGIFFGLPEAIYRKSPGVSISTLKPMAKSPKAYRYAKDNPKPRTAAMAFGTILHSILLTPHETDSLVITRPDKWDSFRSKEAREWRDAQTAIVVSNEELAEIHACADAVRKDPKAAWILERAQKEVSIFKRHEPTGLLLKGRLDMPFMDSYGDTCIADIKKVSRCDKRSFSMVAADFLYDLQASYYLRLLGASHFFFICVEDEPPYEVAIYQVDEETMQQAWLMCEKLLAQLAECMAKDEWPGRNTNASEIETIRIAPWGRI